MLRPSAESRKVSRMQCADARRQRRTWLGILGLVAIGAAASSPTCAEDARAPPDVRIASWTVRDVPEARAPEDLARAQQPSWRTTFGAERRSPTPEETALGASLKKGSVVVDADVVAVRGIRSLKGVRRLFPRASWRLVFSRHAMATAAKGEIAALAIRVRLGLRVVEAQEVGRDIAVGLLIDGRRLSVLATGVPLACFSAAAGAPCGDAKVAQQWMVDRTGAGQRFVIAGEVSEAVPPAEAFVVYPTVALRVASPLVVGGGISRCAAIEVAPASGP